MAKGTGRLDFLLRRNYFDGHLDEFKDMFPTWLNPAEVEGYYADRIRALGRMHGLKLEVFYSGFDERFVVFATNGKGFRTHFLTVESSAGGFHPLDALALRKVREAIYWSKNVLRYTQELRREREEARVTRDVKRIQELEYGAQQYRGVFRRMARLLGVESGKVRFPFGAKSVGRF